MEKKIELSMNEVMQIVATTLNKIGDIPNTCVDVTVHWDVLDKNKSTMTLSWEE